MERGFEPGPFWLLHPYPSLPGLASSSPTTTVNKDLAENASLSGWDIMPRLRAVAMATFFLAKQVGEIC